MLGRKYLIPFCISILCISVFGQQEGKFAVDSFKGKSYEYLLEKSEEEDVETSKIYSIEYLKKAKSEKNWKHIMNAYKIILHLSDKKDRIYYADSMIYAAKHTQENDLVASAYLTKGILYYDLTDYNNALDNYLIANRHLIGTNDQYLEFKANYNIAQIKYYLGYYEEAAQLFKASVDFFKNQENIPYLTSLHSLALCYNRLGKFDLCTATNDLGIKESERLECYEAIPRFINSEGINQFFKKNYTVSIGKLNETAPSFIKSRDFAGEVVTYFYLGKNYWSMNQPEKAMQYFLKVNEAFTERNYIYPNLRESFEITIDYYKSKNDPQKQLKYINQLLQADKYLNSNYKYLTGRIYKEYDTQKLLQSKRAIEKSLRSEKQQNLFYIILIAILLIWLGYLIYKSRESKRKFRKLIDRKTQQVKLTAETKLRNTGNLKMNPEVKASILKHLDKFENSEQFLAKDITLPKLAKKFDTNIVYVSKVISHSRQKRSNDYINDLKIDWIITQLRENSKFRNYTNKALGEEAGFSTTQHFTRAFSKNTGLSPTFFVQELKSAIAAGNLP
jgi:tetratricopeptide (TPR) repeat protein